VTFRHSGLRFSRNPDHVAIYGTEGVLHIEGAYVQGTMELSHDGETWQQLEIPDEILERLSAEQNPTQRNWNQLASDLVRDIRAEPVDKYLTFHDGWLYQEVIDIVRRGDGWHRPGI
jgi:predicted dehydrogenase